MNWTGWLLLWRRTKSRNADVDGVKGGRNGPPFFVASRAVQCRCEMLPWMGASVRNRQPMLLVGRACALTLKIWRKNVLSLSF